MMQLLLLQLPPRARRNDPETSHLAAASVQRISETQAMILRILRAFGPATDEVIWTSLKANATPTSESGARTRRKELVEMGLVVASSETGKTRAGRNCTVWMIKG